MSVTSPSVRQLTGARGLERVRRELSGRDLAIVGQIGELRLMSGLQIGAIHFAASEHETPAAGARACQRALQRLVQERVLIRLERRVGGIRAGSASFIYGLGPVGARLVLPAGRRRRFYEPTARFVDHTLAISQLVVDLTSASRKTELELLQLQAEPRCHRQWIGVQGTVVLKPDVFVSVGVGDYEHRWFVEVDLDTESVPVLQRKCRAYESYRQSGKEQAVHGVFPKVCWIVPSERRAAQVRTGIAEDRRLSEELFVVTTVDQALRVLGGGVS